MTLQQMRCLFGFLCATANMKPFLQRLCYSHHERFQEFYLINKNKFNELSGHQVKRRRLSSNHSYLQLFEALL